MALQKTAFYIKRINYTKQTITNQEEKLYLKLLDKLRQAAKAEN